MFRYLGETLLLEDIDTAIEKTAANTGINIETVRRLFTEVDPTYDKEHGKVQGKYGQWLARLYRAGNITEDDFIDARNALDEFNRKLPVIKSDGGKTDIGQYRTIEDVQKIISETEMPETSAKQARKQARNLSTEGSFEERFTPYLNNGSMIKFADTPNYEVFIPLKFEASVALSVSLGHRGDDKTHFSGEEERSWCTGHPGNDSYWQQYLPYGPLIVFLRKGAKAGKYPKAEDKWQFSVADGCSLFDGNDDGPHPFTDLKDASAENIVNDAMFIYSEYPDQWIDFKVLNLADFNKLTNTEAGKEHKEVVRIKEILTVDTWYRSTGMSLWPYLTEAQQVIFRDKPSLFFHKNGYDVGSTHYDLSGADLSGVIFDGLDVSGISFKGADLSSATFKEAYLNHSDFSGATLSHTDFTDASLIASQFSETKLEGAIFDEACLRRAKFFNCTNHHVSFDAADCREVLFQGMPMDGVLMTSVDASDASFIRVTMKDSNLSRGIFYRAHFKSVDLTGSIFDNWCIDSSTEFQNVKGLPKGAQGGTTE